MNLLEDVRDITEIEAACSLPMYNKSCETVFTYVTHDLDEEHFKISRIMHMYCRPHGTDEIIEIRGEQYFSEQEMKELLESVNRFINEDESIAEMYEEYLERYESFCEYCFQEQLSLEQRENNGRMLELLEMMFAGTVFKKIYDRLGSEMISYLKAYC